MTGKGDDDPETRAELLRAMEKLESISQTQGQDTKAFRQAQNEVADLIQRLGGIRGVMGMGELDELEESIIMDDEAWEDEFGEPKTPIVELLPDLAQVGVTLARTMETLEDWAEWLEDEDDQRSTILKQAHQSLLEADGAIHATAAMLHLYMTGAPPPDELLNDNEDES